jgi:hypothetical protein
LAMTTKRLPTEAALLLLLRMKPGLLLLQIGDEFSDPLVRQLVRQSRDNASVMLDFLVDLVALVTHGRFRICANKCSHQPLLR